MFTPLEAAATCFSLIVMGLALISIFWSLLKAKRLPMSAPCPLSDNELGMLLTEARRRLKDIAGTQFRCVQLTITEYEQSDLYPEIRWRVSVVSDKEGIDPSSGNDAEDLDEVFHKLKKEIEFHSRP